MKSTLEFSWSWKHTLSCSFHAMYIRTQLAKFPKGPKGISLIYLRGKSHSWHKKKVNFPSTRWGLICHPGVCVALTFIIPHLMSRKVCHMLPQAHHQGPPSINTTLKPVGTCTVTQRANANNCVGLRWHICLRGESRFGPQTLLWTN